MNTDLNSNLNLARKWRSKNFDQIIGQELCVRILRNALYLNSFFPVYIFSGQRGCGKTSTARIFSAAINCEQLSNFQKNPKEISIPCLQCHSCISMKDGKHPDFIEIDAASHTGVDNVRNIIEASSLLPLIGRKKIYLIDEAHMLSKAAFNAFLKILEEPPASVLFILATTDVNKIIDTVKSRSFQLFFISVSENNLVNHLENICKQESIEYEIEGLKIIIRESEGSVRDAINLLEQVRFSAKSVNKEAVLDVLGYLSDDNLLIIFEFLINKKNESEVFLKFLNDINFYSYSPEYIWNNLLELFSLSIKIKNRVLTNSFSNQKKLSEILSKKSLTEILQVMDQFFKNEFLFSKSLNKHIFLELLFLRIIHSGDIQIKNQKNSEILESPKINFSNEQKNDEPKINDNWNKFLDEIKKLDEPLLNSIFSQAKFAKLADSQVTIAFQEKLSFFKELIDNTSNIWQTKLKEVFGSNATLNIEFNLLNEQEKVVEKKIERVQNKVILNSKITKNNNTVDVSDKSKWKMANELLKHFPGTIHEVQEINE